MLDQARQPVQPDQAEQIGYSESGKIRSLLPIAIVGLVLVIVALLLLLWPTGQFGDTDVRMIPHVARILRSIDNETGLNLPRRLLDVGIYIVLLAGIGFLVVAWRRGTRSALVGLIAVSILGLSYMSGMALYTGPMIATCGFLLVLFGAVVAWTTTRDKGADENDENTALHSTDSMADQKIDGSDTLELGTDENAPHPVA